ncbi:MAG: dihydropteroate synthase, partial [Bdellovibrionales bacterium]|nr:dihydropteroate synthase [Bdellovibrionales bacterium]
MKLKLQSKNTVMGILNLTPDSFSDGGDYNESGLICSRIDSFLKQNVEIFDFGAESTAPMNNHVSYEEEINRFEQVLFPALKHMEEIKEKIISIDTYKIETIKYVLNYTRKWSPLTQIIWNDVSGRYQDKEVIEIINENSNNLFYVANFTFIPERRLTTKHMEYKKDITNIEFQNEFFTYFSSVNNYFEKSNLLKNLIIDPGFGFSKSLTQNHYLMKNFSKIINQLMFDVPILVGISKKSFLKHFTKDLIQLDDNFDLTELLHGAFMSS